MVKIATIYAKRAFVKEVSKQDPQIHKQVSEIGLLNKSHL